MSLSLTLSNPPYYQDSGIPASSYLSIGLNIKIGQFYLDNSVSDFYICTDNSNQNALLWKKIPKLDQIPTQIQSDWAQSNSGSVSFINNKPTIPGGQINSDWNSSSGLSQILNKPNLSTVATSGSYNDLNNKPTIPSPQVQSDWTQANSGSTDFIKNKPVRSQSSVARSLNTAFQISSTRDALANYSINISATISLTSGQTGTVIMEIASDSGFTTNVQQIASSVNGNTGTLAIGLNLTQTATCTLSGYIPTAYYCRLRTVNTAGSPSFSYQYGQEILL